MATHCNYCNKEFVPYNVKADVLTNTTKTADLELVKIPCIKVAHHLHHRKGNNFIDSICSKCNLAVQSKRLPIPIFCHNFSKFDHVFLLKYLCKFWENDIKIISKSENCIMSITARPFTIKDSLGFLTGSLDSNIELVKNK